MGLMDLEKVYDKVNREALCQVLRMCDVGDKLLNSKKSLYLKSLACVTVKRGESECFRINSGVRRVYHVPLALQCIYGCNDKGGYYYY